MEETLAKFMANGMPQWKAFHELIGGLIAELRLQYPAVRAYGEMVDVLWQRGEREAANRLEEYWNVLGRLQTFSLFCAYRIDPLDSQAYGGALECVCKTHTHLIPRPMRRASTRRWGSEPQGPRPAARAAAAIARCESPAGHAHAERPGGALLAEAEHAANCGEGSRGDARRSAQRAAGGSFASSLTSSLGS